MYQGTAAARTDATLRARDAEAKAEGEAVVDAIETPKMRDLPTFHIIHFYGVPKMSVSGHSTGKVKDRIRKFVSRKWKVAIR
jgi:hypothetical protein